MPHLEPMVGDGDLLQVLRGFNPWWQSGLVPGSRPYRRIAYHEARRWMYRTDLRRAVLLSGARRVGKTTILYQLAEEALKGGLPRRSCLYLSFDHPLLKLAALDRLVDLFRSQISEGAEELLVLLDEIQYAPDWAVWLKWLVDQFPRVRIAATGSASAILRSGGQESGAGRWLEIAVPTLSFYEYVHLTDLPMPDIPAHAIPTTLTRLPAPEAQQILNSCLALRPHLPRYLLQGGFPETALATDLASAQRLVREDVVERVLKRDMTVMYGVRSVLELERLFLYCCLHSGGMILQERVASQLGVTRATVANLLAALEAANLIYRCLPVAVGGKKTLKPRTKVYLADSSIRGAVLLRGEESLEESTEAGLIVETAVYHHLYAFYYGQRPQIGYWRDPGSDQEVDIVVALPARRWQGTEAGIQPGVDSTREGRTAGAGLGVWTATVAIEVKYREDPPAKLSLDVLRKQEAPSASILVTKHPQQFGSLRRGEPDGIFQIPAFLFLYLLGHAERRAVDAPGSVREA